MCEQNYSKILKDNLITLRRRKKMTQEQLAEQLGLTFQAVSKWENGLSCPDITLLPQIAQIFGVTLDALFAPMPSEEEQVENAAEVKTEQPEEGKAEKEGQGAEPSGEAQTGKEAGGQDSRWESSAGSFFDASFATIAREAERLRSSVSRHVANAMREVDQKMNGKKYNPFPEDEFVEAFVKDCDEGDSNAQIHLDTLPWEDDGVYRAVLFCGRQIKTVPVNKDGKDRLIVPHDLDEKLLSAFTVECGNVEGEVVSRGNVTCGEVVESVHAGGNVACGDVGDTVNAGGSVSAASVGDSVKAGGGVTCSEIGDSVHCGGSVKASGDIGGDVQCGGSVNCVTVSGDVKTNTLCCEKVEGSATFQNWKR